MIKKASGRIWALILAILFVIGSIPLHVWADDPEDGLQIRRFAALDSTVGRQVVPLGISTSELILPDMLDVVYSNRSEGSVPVLFWSSADYDPMVESTYLFDPVFVDDLSLKRGVSYPRITVIVTDTPELYHDRDSFDGSASRRIELTVPELPLTEDPSADMYGIALDPEARMLWDIMRELEAGQEDPFTLGFSGSSLTVGYSGDTRPYVLLGSAQETDVSDAIDEAFSSIVKNRIAQPAYDAYRLDFPDRTWLSEFMKVDLNYTVADSVLYVDSLSFTFEYYAGIMRAAGDAEVRLEYAGGPAGGQIMSLTDAVAEINTNGSIPDDTVDSITIVVLQDDGNLELAPLSSVEKPLTVKGENSSTKTPIKSPSTSLIMKTAVRFQNLTGLSLGVGSTAYDVYLKNVDVEFASGITFGTVTFEAGTTFVNSGQFRTNHLVLGDATAEDTIIEIKERLVIRAYDTFECINNVTILYSGYDGVTPWDDSNTCLLYLGIDKSRSWQGTLTFDTSEENENYKIFTGNATPFLLIEKIGADKNQTIIDVQQHVALGSNLDPEGLLELNYNDSASNSDSYHQFDLEIFGIELSRPSKTDISLFFKSEGAETAFFRASQRMDDAVDTTYHLDADDVDDSYITLRQDENAGGTDMPQKGAVTVRSWNRSDGTPRTLYINDNYLTLHRHTKFSSIILSGGTSSSPATLTIDADGNNLTFGPDALGSNSGVTLTDTTLTDSNGSGSLFVKDDINVLKISDFQLIEVDDNVALISEATVTADRISLGAGSTLQAGDTITTDDLLVKDSASIDFAGQTTDAPTNGILDLSGGDPATLVSGGVLTINVADTQNTGYTPKAGDTIILMGTKPELDNRGNVVLGAGFERFALEYETREDGQYAYRLVNVVVSVHYGSDPMQKFSKMSSAAAYVDDNRGGSELRLWTDITLDSDSDLPSLPYTLNGVYDEDEDLYGNITSITGNEVALNASAEFKNIAFENGNTPWDFKAGAHTLTIGSNVAISNLRYIHGSASSATLNISSGLECDGIEGFLTINLSIAGIFDPASPSSNALVTAYIHDFGTLNGTSQTIALKKGYKKDEPSGQAQGYNFEFPNSGSITGSITVRTSDEQVYKPEVGDYLFRAPAGGQQNPLLNVELSDGYDEMVLRYLSNPNNDGYDYYVLTQAVEVRFENTSNNTYTFVYGEPLTLTAKLYYKNSSATVEDRTGTMTLTLNQKTYMQPVNNGVNTGGVVTFEISDLIDASDTAYPATVTYEDSDIVGEETDATVNVLITKRPVTPEWINDPVYNLVDEVIVQNKTYDGTTAVQYKDGKSANDLITLEQNDPGDQTKQSGILSQDAGGVYIADSSVQYDTKDAGTDKILTASNPITLDGGRAHNYAVQAISPQTRTSDRIIIPRDVLVVPNTIIKTYDGDKTVDTSAITFASLSAIDGRDDTGLVDNDDVWAVMISGVTMEYDEKDAGDRNVSITSSGEPFELGSSTGDADNYNPKYEAPFDGRIDPKELQVNVITDSNTSLNIEFTKVYDGKWDYETVAADQQRARFDSWVVGPVPNETPVILLQSVSYPSDSGSHPDAGDYKNADGKGMVVALVLDSAADVNKNYTLVSAPATQPDGVITKRTVPLRETPVTIEVHIVNKGIEQRDELDGLFHFDADSPMQSGDRTYSAGSLTNNAGYFDSPVGSYWSIVDDNGVWKLIHTPSNDLEENDTATIRTVISSTNFEDITGEIKLLAIDKTELDVTIDLSVLSSSKVYDGKPMIADEDLHTIYSIDTGNIPGVPQNLKVDIVFEGTDNTYYSEDHAPTDAGSYTVTVSIDDPDFMGSDSAPFVITKRPLLLTPSDKSFTLGETVPVWTDDEILVSGVAGNSDSGLVQGELLADIITAAELNALKDRVEPVDSSIDFATLLTDGDYPVHITPLPTAQNYEIESGRGVVRVARVQIPADPDGWLVFTPPAPDGDTDEFGYEWYLTEIDVRAVSGGVNGYDIVSMDPGDPFAAYLTLSEESVGGAAGQSAEEVDIYMSNGTLYTDPFHFSYRLDKTKPVLQNKDFDANGPGVSGGVITVDVSDAHSGVRYVCLTFEGLVHVPMTYNDVTDKWEASINRPGNYTITARDRAGNTETAQLTVDDNEIAWLDFMIEHESVNVTGDTLEFGIDAWRIPLDAVVTDGNVDEGDYTWSWSTGNASVAVIQQTEENVPDRIYAIVTGVGETIITAEAMGVERSVTIRIKEPEDPGIIVPPPGPDPDDMELVVEILPNGNPAMEEAIRLSGDAVIRDFLTESNWADKTQWMDIYLIWKSTGEKVTGTELGEEPFTVFIRYPDGVSPQWDMILLHESSGRIEWVEMIRRTSTIQFTTTDLSPFSLTWKTGDDGPDPGGSSGDGSDGSGGNGSSGDGSDGSGGNGSSGGGSDGSGGNGSSGDGSNGNGSSGGGNSGGSIGGNNYGGGSGNRKDEFWPIVRDEINRSKEGETIIINVPNNIETCPSYVLDDLLGKDKTLVFNWNGEVIVINGMDLHLPDNRMWYYLSWLLEMFGYTGEVEPNTVVDLQNPIMGGDDLVVLDSSGLVTRTVTLPDGLSDAGAAQPAAGAAATNAPDQAEQGGAVAALAGGILGSDEVQRSINPAPIIVILAVILVAAVAAIRFRRAEDRAVQAATMVSDRPFVVMPPKQRTSNRHAPDTEQVEPVVVDTHSELPADPQPVSMEEKAVPSTHVDAAQTAPMSVAEQAVPAPARSTVAPQRKQIARPTATASAAVLRKQAVQPSAIQRPEGPLSRADESFFNVMDAHKQLRQLLDQGAITREEYERKKRQLIMYL